MHFLSNGVEVLGPLFLSPFQTFKVELSSCVVVFIPPENALLLNLRIKFYMRGGLDLMCKFCLSTLNVKQSLHILVWLKLCHIVDECLKFPKNLAMVFYLDSSSVHFSINYSNSIMYSSTDKSPRCKRTFRNTSYLQ